MTKKHLKRVSNLILQLFLCFSSSISSAVANINAAKSVVENGVAKKKAAFSEHDPNLDNKSDEKGKEKEKKQDLAEMSEFILRFDYFV